MKIWNNKKYKGYTAIFKPKEGKTMKNLVCEYCGAVREVVQFVIGASRKADWCMHEGTGKVSCPECYDKAQEEAKKIIDNLVK